MVKQLADYSWEYYFNDEALKVEELLASGQLADYGKSRLRIALEQNILSWSRYKEWFTQLHHTSSLTEHLGPSDIINLNEIFHKNAVYFSDTMNLGKDHIALQMWDKKTVVLGLSYTEKIQQMPNIIFVLCSPQILNLISDPNCSQLAISTAWSEIDQKHFDFCVQARKSFDAFVVLKIKNNQTELFKLDEDLNKENITAQTFQFSLTEPNPFSNAIKLDQSQNFELSSINMKVLDYVSGTITPLKKGQNCVGFLLGLKTTLVNAQDSQTLEEISSKVS